MSSASSSASMPALLDWIAGFEVARALVPSNFGTVKDEHDLKAGYGIGKNGR